MPLSVTVAIRELLQFLPPLEVALTIGVALFLLSWLLPRRIVSFAVTGQRATILAWTGLAGPLLVVLVATATSAIAATTQDLSGFAGWWRRPAPLLVASLVIGAAALALRTTQLPPAGQRAILPRRPWHRFASRPLLRVAAAGAALLALTGLWQIVTATSAPEDARFFGDVAHHTTLPIYLSFHNQYGYVAGAGWPNHLATLLVLVLSGLVLVAALRADASRPLPARASAAAVHGEREPIARLFVLILLGGLAATLGAVWMHVGAIGQVLVGVDEQWLAGGESHSILYLVGGYDAIAWPMNLVGHVLQGAGVALLLRVAVDTARAALETRRARVPELAGEASAAGGAR